MCFCVFVILFSTTNNLFPSLQVGEPCQCKNKCFDLIGMDNIQQLFRDFWAQNAVIQTQVDVSHTKRRRTDNLQKMCNNHKHFIVIVNDIPVNVCKKAFLSIFGLSQSRVDTATILKKSKNGLPLPDLRGKAGCHNQVTVDSLAAAMEHVRSIPTVTSHYS